MPGNGNFGRTGVRNPTYTGNGRQFAGNRTTAFNTQTSRGNARLTPGNRTNGYRVQGINGNVIARHNGNWNRHWNRNHDHNWNGHRCHFHNGFWYVYDPWPFYPYWGYYPYYDPYYYGGYYDGAYYDGAYSTEPAPAAYTDQSQPQDSAAVSEVQSALARQGYYDGAIDGVAGAGTRRAVRNYQRDHGLQVTGYIDGAVIDALRAR